MGPVGTRRRAEPAPTVARPIDEHVLAILGGTRAEPVRTGDAQHRCEAEQRVRPHPVGQRGAGRLEMQMDGPVVVRGDPRPHLEWFEQCVEPTGCGGTVARKDVVEVPTELAQALDVATRPVRTEVGAAGPYLGTESVHREDGSESLVGCVAGVGEVDGEPRRTIVEVVVVHSGEST